MKTWLTLLLLSILLSGCNSGVQTTNNETVTAGQEILSKGTSSMTNKNYTILNKGNYPISTKGEKETLIFHSDDADDVAAFEEAYLELTNEIAPSFEGTIIIAKMGEKNTGGYSIDVESVVDAGRYTEVTLVSTEPTGLVTMALTNPFVVVYLENDHKDVRVVDK